MVFLWVRSRVVESVEMTGQNCSQNSHVYFCDTRHLGIDFNLCRKRSTDAPYPGPVQPGRVPALACMKALSHTAILHIVIQRWGSGEILHGRHGVAAHSVHRQAQVQATGCGWLQLGK